MRNVVPVCATGAPGSTPVAKEACGVVTDVNEPFQPVIQEIRHLAAVDFCPGDNPDVGPISPGFSGGPVYKNHRACGIISGNRKNGCEGLYQGIRDSATAMNVGVMTGG
jgi:hypothetical protein